MLSPMSMMGMPSERNSPTQMMYQTLGQIQKDPLFQRAQQMAEGKSPEELKQIAINLCQQRGIDLNQAFTQFNFLMGNLSR